MVWRRRERGLAILFVWRPHSVHKLLRVLPYRDVADRVRIVYFLGTPVEKISVSRCDHEGPPLEKRKRLKDLKPPLNKDTVLYFSRKEPQDHLKEAENRDDQRDKIKTEMEETEINDTPRERESQESLKENDEVNTAGQPYRMEN